jgi:hypothetical protein
MVPALGEVIMKSLPTSLRPLCFFLLSAPSLVACTGQTVDEPVVGQSTDHVWTAQSQKLVAERTFGFMPMRDAANPCSASRFAFDASTSAFEATLCIRGDKVATENRALTGDEAKMLMDQLSELRTIEIAKDRPCTADADRLAFETTDTAGSSTKFLDDLSVCKDATARVVDHQRANDFLATLESLALKQAIPAVWSGYSRAIRLARYEGMAPRSNGNECLPGETYQFDRDARTLLVDLCDGGKVIPQQNVSLTDVQAKGLVVALAKLRVAKPAEKSCAIDGPAIAVKVTADSGEPKSYVDSLNACNPDDASQNVVEVGTANDVLAKLRELARSTAPLPIWKERSRTITVTAYEGFAPRPNGNECSSSSYTYEPSLAKLHASICDGGKLLPSIDKVLTSAQVAEAAPLLAALREAKESEKECWMDAASFRANVTDDIGAGQSYIDSHNVCNATSEKVWEASSAEALVAKLYKLAQ